MKSSLKIAVIGKTGQIGWELCRTLGTVGSVVALDRAGLDLTKTASIRAAIQEIHPALIVNAAAYTAVDHAETEPDVAFAVNARAPAVIAEEARRVGAALIHYSTDYVFDGTKSGPYTEEDSPNPLSVYGRSKLEGERAIQAIGVPYLILRTSWVYSARGRNFLLTVLRLAKERDELRIVDDQIGAPTWSRMAAEATGQIVGRCYSPLRHQSLSIGDLTGVYHLTASGHTSWFGFAKEILQEAAPGTVSRTLKVHPITTDQYLLPAKRPANSVLSTEKLSATFKLLMPDWMEDLRLCLDSASSSAQWHSA